MNSYRLSDGSRMTKGAIDRMIRRAKSKKIERMEYPHCERCGRSTGVRLDISHIISVNEAQNSGRTELAFCVNNLEMLCRDHHHEMESKARLEREEHFKSKLNGTGQTK